MNWDIELRNLTTYRAVIDNRIVKKKKIKIGGGIE